MTPIRRWIASAVALLVVLALGGRTEGADCPPERNRPKVIFVGEGTHQFDADMADLLSDDFFSKLMRGTPGVDFCNLKDVAMVLGRDALLQQMAGADAIGELAGALGSPFFVKLTFDQVRTSPVTITRTMSVSLIDTHESTLMRRFGGRLPNDDDRLLSVIDPVRVQFMNDLRCVLLAAQTRPAVPLLVVSQSPGEVSPGGTVHVNAKLTDSSTGQPQGGRQLQVHTWQGRVLVSTAPYVTNDSGVVSADLTVGPDPGPHSVSVTFTDARGRTTPSNPPEIAYNVFDPSGDVTISAPEAALRLGAAQTLTARHTDKGAPVAGATFNFTAEGGGTVATPGVTTDANGYASTQFQAPSTNAIVDVTATTPAPPSKGPKAGAADLTASLTLVVDGAVTLNLNALDTLAGGTSNVTADLVVAGVAIPGANVTFTLAGAGALSAATSPTNAAGRAEIIWLAPAGNSTANITAATVVEGQSYTKTVTITGGAAEGSMSVKVVPLFAILGGQGRTEVRLGADLRSEAGLPNICHYVSTTLLGVQPCNSFPVYGTAAANVPVKLRAQRSAGDWTEMSVTQPDPKVVAVDVSAGFSADLVPTTQYIDIDACLELTFGAAGVLIVETDATSMTGADISSSVYRPKSGVTFGPEGSEDVLRGMGRIDIAQPGTLQLVVNFVDDNGVPPATGTFRFKFTFAPR